MGTLLLTWCWWQISSLATISWINCRAMNHTVLIKVLWKHRKYPFKTVVMSYFELACLHIQPQVELKIIPFGKFCCSYRWQQFEKVRKFPLKSFLMSNFELACKLVFTFSTTSCIVKRVSWFKSSLLLRINNKHTNKY